MKTIEEAYKEISESIIDFVAGREWDSAVCNISIFSKMTRSSWFLIAKEKKEEKSVGWGNSSIKQGDAAIFLRDEIIRVSGQRIWGLTFTLYPNGKFNIMYDYNKPDGYEESDEFITGEEINTSLSKLKGKESDHN